MAALFTGIPFRTAKSSDSIYSSFYLALFTADLIDSMEFTNDDTDIDWHDLLGDFCFHILFYSQTLRELKIKAISIRSKRLSRISCKDCRI